MIANSMVAVSVITMSILTISCRISSRVYAVIIGTITSFRMVAVLIDYITFTATAL